MKKQLTVWQCSMLLSVCLISTKFQRFPALLSEEYENDGWIFLLFILAIDLLFVWMLSSLLIKLKDKTIFEAIEAKFGKVVQIFVCVALTLFFFFKSVITYRGTHEFFANMLFDKLSWFYFSILFALLLIVMVGGGLNGIGRSAELYSYIIGVGLITSICLGVLKTDLWNIMPILDLAKPITLNGVVHYLPWLGDYLVILLFIGNVKIDKNPQRPLLLSYLISGLLVAVVYVVFYCINENLSVYQANALSAITQYSLIGLGVGRPDWFLVLFVFISTIIANAFYVYSYTLSFTEIFRIKRNYLVISLMVLVLFVVDNFLLKNIESSVQFVQNYVGYLALGTMILVPIIAVLSSRARFAGKNKKTTNITYYKKRCVV